MRRLVIALFVLGLCAPLVGDVSTADAQVWKVKRGKAKPGATAAKSKPKATRTARPTLRKKARPTKQRAPSVKDLVPDDEPATESTERREPDEADEPIFIQVEELD